MTHQQLRDLLRERVADETMPDLSAQAWAAGRRTRRRRATLVVGAAAGSVLAVVGIGVALTAPGDPQNRDENHASPAPAFTEPDATYQMLPVWWSPDQVEERSLPLIASPLPEVIELGSGQLATGIDAAVGAFGVGDEVRLVDEDGVQVSLDVSALEDVANENDYRVSPVTDSMLSPDGTRLVFGQDGSVAIYDIEKAEWSGFSTGTYMTAYAGWADDDTIVLPKQRGGSGPWLDLSGQKVGGQSSLVPFPGFDTGSAQIYGPLREVRSPEDDGLEGFFRSSAQSWGMGVPLPVEEGYAADTEFLNAQIVEGLELHESATLAFMNDVGDGQDSRFKQCCPVAGWLDPRTVVYESRQSQPVLVAWTVGTDQFRLVSRIEGAYDVASFASLHD